MWDEKSESCRLKNKAWADYVNSYKTHNQTRTQESSMIASSNLNSSTQPICQRVGTVAKL